MLNEEPSLKQVNPDPNEKPISPSTPTPDGSDRRTANWDIKNAPRNYLALVFAQAATALFSFASVWLITRTLGAEGYGEIIALIAASYVIQIFVSWSTFALPRFGVEEFVQTGKITKTFWTRTLILFPNLLLLLIGSIFLLKPLGGLLKISETSIWLVFAHFLATAIWLHIQFSLQGVKYLKLQGVLLAFERGLTFLFLAILIAINHASFNFVILCYVLPPIFMSIAGLVVLNKFIDKRDFWDREWFRKILVYSLPLIPFGLVGYLSTSQLDAVFITQFLTKADLGIYSVATQISGITLQLPILANTLLLSLFVSLQAMGRNSAVTGFFKNIMPTLTLFWGMFCVGLAFLGYLLIPIVFGKEFSITAAPLLILLNSSVVGFPILVGLATLANSNSKTYISMVSSIGTAISNVTFNFLFIPRLGMVGCALATLLASLVSLVIFKVLLKRQRLLPENWTSLALLPALTCTITVILTHSVMLSLVVCSVTSLVICYFKSDSVKEALKDLRNRLHVKDVPQEPSLG